MFENNFQNTFNFQDCKTKGGGIQQTHFVDIK